jgi:hypothetical protein
MARLLARKKLTPRRLLLLLLLLLLRTRLTTTDASIACPTLSDYLFKVSLPRRRRSRSNGAPSSPVLPPPPQEESSRNRPPHVRPLLLDDTKHAQLLLIGDSGVGKSCLLLRFAVRLFVGRASGRPERA